MINIRGRQNNENPINFDELKDLVKKHNFLEFSDCGEYVIIKTRNSNKKHLEININNPKLRSIIQNNIPINGKKAKSEDKEVIEGVKAYLKRIVNEKGDDSNYDYLVNLGIKKLNTYSLDNKTRAEDTIKQSVYGLLNNNQNN